MFVVIKYSNCFYRSALKKAILRNLGAYLESQNQRKRVLITASQRNDFNIYCNICSIVDLCFGFWFFETVQNYKKTRTKTLLSVSENFTELNSKILSRYTQKNLNQSSPDSSQDLEQNHCNQSLLNRIGLVPFEISQFACLCDLVPWWVKIFFSWVHTSFSRVKRFSCGSKLLLQCFGPLVFIDIQRQSTEFLWSIMCIYTVDVRYFELARNRRFCFVYLLFFTHFSTKVQIKEWYLCQGTGKIVQNSEMLEITRFAA